MFKFLRRLVGAIALVASGWMPAAQAATDTPWAKTPQTEVRLISATDGMGGTGAITLGLQFKLKDGWKVYWRRPGDAGFPPRIDWSESENFKDAEIAWPAPVRFQVLGFQTMGYTNEVVFPIAVRAIDAKRPMLLRARVDYLTCEDICIPYNTSFELALPAGGGAATSNVQLIERFARKVPGDGSADGLAIEAVEIAGAFARIDDQERAGAVRVIATSATPFAKPDVFIEGPELAFFGLPSAQLSEGGRRATITVPVNLEKDEKLERETLRITLTDGARAAERDLVVAPARAAPATAATPFALILLFALAGGALLNLMPCVLPVLSLKIVGVAALGGQSPARIRASFLATSAGIVTSFLAIAAALIVLKSAGTAVGWGIQFQHPWFIAALTVLATLFAANLWGLFEVPLPGWLGGVAARSASDPGRRTLLGDFMTGAVATTLATPCSAPFLGTAVGFALAGAATEIVAIFAVLGIGMALPYLACAAIPGFARILPRPGPWMIRLKQALAFALALTAMWLLTVLAALQSTMAAILIGVTVAAIPLALLFLRRGAAAVTVLAAIAIALPMFLPNDPPSVQARRAKSTSAVWQPFDPAAIPGLIASGKVVFVDITADWCITCQVNKVAVLERPPVKALLESNRVVAMQGDWTRPDPAIAAYLQSFGRYAIPFDAVYGPGLPDGVALSELLTSRAVLDALASASNGALVARN